MKKVLGSSPWQFFSKVLGSFPLLLSLFQPSHQKATLHIQKIRSPHGDRNLVFVVELSPVAADCLPLVSCPPLGREVTASSCLWEVWGRRTVTAVNSCCHALAPTNSPASAVKNMRRLRLVRPQDRVPSTPLGGPPAAGLQLDFVGTSACVDACSLDCGVVACHCGCAEH